MDLTTLDVIVLTAIFAGAVFGYLRGFVQEVLTMCALVFATTVIHFALEPFAGFTGRFVTNPAAASLLALIILFVVSFFSARLVARMAGRRARKSALAPIDRALGVGFGAVKGLLLAALLFLGGMMGYAWVFPSAARPQWVTESHTYPLLNASSNALVDFFENRRAMIAELEVD